MTDGPMFVQADSAEAFAAFQPFVDSNPAFCGLRWWMNLLHRDTQMRHLVSGTVPGREDYWGDYSDAADYLADGNLTSEPETTSRADVVFMKLLPGDYDTDLQVIKSGSTQVRRITMHRCSDGVWRAWSVGMADLDEVG